MNGRPISNTRKMNKYLGLGLVLLASSACSKDTIEQPQQPTAPSEGVTISLEAKQPEFVDLDGELRSQVDVTVSGTGYPVIKLPEVFTGYNPLPALEVRWRYINKAAPGNLPTNENLLPNGLAVKDTGGADTYNSTMTPSDYGKLYARTVTEGGKQYVRLFLPYKAGTFPWWGDAEHDMYVSIATGVAASSAPDRIVAGKHVHTTGGSRVKLYYTGGSAGEAHKNYINLLGGRYGYGPDYNLTLQRRLIVADGTTPYKSFFPYMTTYRKARLTPKADDTNAAAGSSATYGFAGLDNGALEPRGTIMSLSFKNETGASIQVTDVEVKNDAFAYDGYFSGAGVEVPNFVDNGVSASAVIKCDGIAPEAVMTGSEVVAQKHFKFVETNLLGYSKYTLDKLKREDPRLVNSTIPTSATFGVYANGTTTDKGVTIDNGSASGRVFMWGYPKGDGKTALKIKVTYVVNGVKAYAYQRVNAPAEGFQDGKAYLKTIRISKSTAAVSKLTDVAAPTDWATFQ